MITAVKAFEDNIKLFLKEAEIHSYTYQEVNGFKDCSGLSVKDNWFANDKSECESVLFHVFTEESKVEGFLQHAGSFNEEQPTKNAIHAVVVNLDKII
ncbi:hypothetical protein FLJC2902T_29010 [Flavobacterium limnosediminis JC2902]|uniref:Uncharacterized protein n=2 Tax=Flavobacterium TaxID=237 RepID=V6SIX9_9FLAO|nr:hypothetical protein FLJC2902T_29010 [Flavobacterium limnosediminis JC2902]